jgi:hypothetical protein
MFYNNVSGSNVKSKTIAFRVTETDFQALSELAQTNGTEKP